ncbi:MAG: zinc ABC transporter substrate-binding protein [Thermoanaerobaculales bacterium]|jgi:zinc transport system substrate-binding protein|nr:zinc ABC transporter substrate-binding protein [Thermoanaerobaculales bacterium]
MRMPGVLLLALAALACGGTGSPDAPTRLSVAASIPPHGWLVERIGGDAVEVAVVLGPGDSPATHQPSDAQVSRVLASRVFFSSGVPFESGAWFDAVAGALEVVALDRGIADRRMDAHHHDATHDHGSSGNGLDPHAWLSPGRLAEQAQRVSVELSRLDPDRAAIYAGNLNSLNAGLGELDRWIRATLTPHRGRAFVVFHPSWGYFADDYDLEQIAIETEGKEPSDAEITDLQREARERGVSVVFVQPQIAGRSARAVAEAIGADLVTLDPLAADVPANLRRTAAAIAGSFDE